MRSPHIGTHYLGGINEDPHSQKVSGTANQRTR